MSRIGGAGGIPCAKIRSWLQFKGSTGISSFDEKKDFVSATAEIEPCGRPVNVHCVFCALWRRCSALGICCPHEREVSQRTKILPIGRLQKSEMIFVGQACKNREEDQRDEQADRDRVGHRTPRLMAFSAAAGEGRQNMQWRRLLCRLSDKRRTPVEKGLARLRGGAGRRRRLCDDAEAQHGGVRPAVVNWPRERALEVLAYSQTNAGLEDYAEQEPMSETRRTAARPGVIGVPFTNHTGWYLVYSLG